MQQPKLKSVCSDSHNDHFIIFKSLMLEMFHLGHMVIAASACRSDPVAKDAGIASD